MAGVSIGALLGFDANEFVLHMHVHLINVTIMNQLFTITIRLQKRNCVTQFLLR